MKPLRSIGVMILGYLLGNLILLMTYKFPAPLSGFYEKISFTKAIHIFDEIIFISFFYILVGGWLYFSLLILLIYIIQRKINLNNTALVTLSFFGGALFSAIVLVLTLIE